MPTDAELAARLVVAALVGGVIGFEREIYDHPAGLRTHMTVCLGAALFAVVSAYGFFEFQRPRAETVLQADVTRVASNIVTGVGFLGGGAILKYGATVKGLTTAASLWVTAALGLAVGLGSYVPAGVAAGALLVALFLLRFPRDWIDRRIALSRRDVVVGIIAGGDPGTVVSAIHAIDGVTIKALEIGRDDEGLVLQGEVEARRGVNVHEALSSLATLDAVRAVELN